MKMSVIIPFTKGDKERQEGLEAMLQCIKRQTFRDFELILAEMTRDGTTVYLPYKPDNHIVLKHDGIFNKSWVCNVAVKQAKHDFLLFLDADTLFYDDYFQAIAEYYEQYKNEFFLPWKQCRMLAGRDEPTERIVDAMYLQGAAHAWCVTKDFYWKIGGMNEKYFGYGAEDQDFYERARHFLKVIFQMDVILSHTYHHFHPKDSAFPLNPRRVDLIEETRRSIEDEIRKLKGLELGGLEPHYVL